MAKRVFTAPGQRYGALTVLARVGRRGRVAIWRCRCDCGEETRVFATNLRSGGTISCGHVRDQRRAESRRTHGLSDTPTHKAWDSMRQRCTNPNNPSWSRYGGRGITVCERWSASFENFLYDMGERPVGCSIERKDNDGPYEPANCVWATRRQQASNRRTSVFITHDGTTLIVAEWARRLGKHRNNIYAALRRGKRGGEALGLKPKRQ